MPTGSSQPLDPAAAQRADAIFYRNHPKRKGKPIQRGEKGYQRLCEEWQRIYNSQLVALELEAKQEAIVPPIRRPPPPPPKRRPPPPPPKSAGSKKPVGAPVRDCPLCPCAIKQLDVTCCHGRKPSDSGVLQVVHGTDITEEIFSYDGTQSADMTKAEVKETADLFGCWGRLAGKSQAKASKVAKTGMKFTIVKKYAAGEDKESVTAKVTNNKSGGSKFWCVNSTGGVAKSEWLKGQGGTKSLPPRTDGGVFPSKVPGTRHYVHGKGCNDVTKTVTAEVFPSQQYEVTVGAALFGGWADQINGVWDKWGNGILGKNSPVDLALTLAPPTGAVVATWGWQEDKADWRAFYGVAINGGLNPIIGIKMEISVSLMVIAGGAWGIPPCASKLLAEHLADISVGIGAGASVSLMAGCERRWYTDGAITTLGKATVTGKGSLSLFLKASIGSKYVAKVEARGTLECTIVIDGRAEFTKEGSDFTTTGKLPPAQIILSIKGTVFVLFSTSKEKAWDLWKGDKVLW